MAGSRGGTCFDPDETVAQYLVSVLVDLLSRHLAVDDGRDMVLGAGDLSELLILHRLCSQDGDVVNIGVVLLVGQPMGVLEGRVLHLQLRFRPKFGFRA